MTTLVEVSKKCFVCGSESFHEETRSTNFFGEPDLDLRPPEMMRSTIGTWIQCCPNCLYCASDISIGNEDVRNLVLSEAYQNLNIGSLHSGLSIAFLRSSILQEMAGNLEAAIMSAIHSAWVCDDHHDSENARFFRLRALHIIKDFEESGKSFCDGNSQRAIIISDLWRRIGDMTKVIDFVREELQKRCSPEKRIVLQYQKSRATIGDDGPHTMDSAKQHIDWGMEIPEAFGDLIEPMSSLDSLDGFSSLTQPPGVSGLGKPETLKNVRMLVTCLLLKPGFENLEAQFPDIQGFLIEMGKSNARVLRYLEKVLSILSKRFGSRPKPYLIALENLLLGALREILAPVFRVNCPACQADLPLDQARSYICPQCKESIHVKEFENSNWARSRCGKMIHKDGNGIACSCGHWFPTREFEKQIRILLAEHIEKAV